MPNITIIIIIIRILHSITLVAVVVVTLAERRAFLPIRLPPPPALIRHQHSAQLGSILTLKIARVHRYSMGTLYNIIMCIIKRVCSVVWFCAESHGRKRQISACCRQPHHAAVRLLSGIEIRYRPSRSVYIGYYDVSTFSFSRLGREDRRICFSSARK